MSSVTWRLIGLMAAAAYILYTLLRPQDWTFLNFADLVFHEAGHVLFTPFGEFLYLLGGSLTQVLLPALVALYFGLWRGDRYASACGWLWCAQNLGNVSVYVADAQARTLPLITGDPDTHDWWQLLVMTNHLDASVGLGRAVLVAGFLVFGWALWTGWRWLSTPTEAEAATT